MKYWRKNEKIIILWKIIKLTLRFFKNMFILTSLCYTSPDKYDPGKLLNNIKD